MRRLMVRATGVVGAALLVGQMFVAGTAAAATYDVTSGRCTGTGSFTAAVAAANAHAGADTISFAPGLKVDWGSCPSVNPLAQRNFAAVITESVTIDGNGAVLDGQQGWIDTSGVKSPLTNCPSAHNLEGTFVVATAPGLFEVGAPGADNSGVSVVVNNLSFLNASQVAKVRAGASLTLDHVQMKNIVNIIGNCGDGALYTSGDAHITLRDSVLLAFVSPGNTLPSTTHFGAVYGSGQLDIVRTRFALNRTNGAFFWGGTVNVVSSQLIDSGGFLHFGGALNFVNSTYYVSKGNIAQSDRIVAQSGSNMTIRSSSLTTYGYGCDHNCPVGAVALMFVANGGAVHFASSAVGNTAERTEIAPMLLALSGGSFTADSLTWMQPTALQDGAALAALTGQPALLTGAPGLLENGNELIDYYPSPVSPLLGSVATPGVLIDAVPDANGANQLLDPITGLALTTDVFGNPRVDANGRRNIGAIQTQLAPHLKITDARFGTASLAWTRPRDPQSGAITGYNIRYRRVGEVTWGAPGAVNGPDSVTAVVNGLTDGVEYEFQVTAVNGSGDGPSSNVVTGKPFGNISAPIVSPVAGNGQVRLTWTPPDNWGGFPPSNQYFVSWHEVGQPDGTNQVPVVGTSNVVTGLVNGRNYEFCVIARALDWSTGSCSFVTAVPVAPASSTTTAPSTTTPTLPATGSASGDGATLAFALVGLGGALLLVRRRGVGRV